MANLCVNHMIVCGEPKTLDALLDTLLSDPTEANTTYWIPQSWTLDHAAFSTDEVLLYRWASFGVTLSFVSAWEPPLDFLQALSASFPSLYFGLDYQEPAVVGYGTVVCSNGNITAHDQRDEPRYGEEGGTTSFGMICAALTPYAMPPI